VKPVPPSRSSAETLELQSSTAEIDVARAGLATRSQLWGFRSETPKAGGGQSGGAGGGCSTKHRKPGRPKKENSAIGTVKRGSNNALHLLRRLTRD
jgi:hypothetical protein